MQTRKGSGSFEPDLPSLEQSLRVCVPDVVLPTMYLRAVQVQAAVFACGSTSFTCMLVLLHHQVSKVPGCLAVILRAVILLAPWAAVRVRG